MRKDFDSIRQMAKAMSKEWLPLLEKTLPKIVVHIFPHFAAGEFYLIVQVIVGVHGTVTRTFTQGAIISLKVCSLVRVICPCLLLLPLKFSIVPMVTVRIMDGMGDGSVFSHLY